MLTGQGYVEYVLREYFNEADVANLYTLGTWTERLQTAVRLKTLRSQRDCRVLCLVSQEGTNGQHINLLACAKLALRPVACGCNFLTPNLMSGAGPVFCGTNGAGDDCCGIGGTGGKLLLPNPLAEPNPVGCVCMA